MKLPIYRITMKVLPLKWKVAKLRNRSVELHCILQKNSRMNHLPVMNIIHCTVTKRVNQSSSLPNSFPPTALLLPSLIQSLQVLKMEVAVLRRLQGRSFPLHSPLSLSPLSPSLSVFPSFLPLQSRLVHLIVEVLRLFPMGENGVVAPLWDLPFHTINSLLHNTNLTPSLSHSLPPPCVSPIGPTLCYLITQRKNRLAQILQQSQQSVFSSFEGSISQLDLD